MYLAHLREKSTTIATHLYSSPGRTFTGELSTFIQGSEEDGGVPSNIIGSSLVPVNITAIAVDTL